MLNPMILSKQNKLLLPRPQYISAAKFLWLRDAIFHVVVSTAGLLQSWRRFRGRKEPDLVSFSRLFPR